MIRGLVAKDLRRGLGANAVLFGFFFVTALLACGGAGTAARLLGATDSLFAAAAAPDAVQMSSGEIDESQIAEFAASRPEVEDYLVSKAAIATGDALWFGDATQADSSSVMEYYFVTQNSSFDRLLGLDNKPVQVAPGQIGVPIYDMLRHGLRTGDRLRVKTPAGEMSFAITSFLRDAQMNPAMISSKRLLVAPADLGRLSELLAQSEHLIEFRLSPGASTAAFLDAYREAGLPQAGPSVDAGLLRAAAFLSDGLVVAVLLLASLLLLIIGVICLRFAVVSAIAASYRELGVLRAIGAPLGFIRRVFSAKYIALAAAGCLLGWSGALVLAPSLTQDALLYTGEPASPVGMLIAASGAGAGLFTVVAASCWLAVRAVGKVSATQALRDGMIGGAQPGRRRWPLSSGRSPVTWYLGLRDLHLRPQAYLVPLAVFAIAAFLLIVPVNFLATANSPTFVQYMGIGLSEVRLDAPVNGDNPELPSQVMARIAGDPDIGRAAQTTVYRCALLPATGQATTSLVETGDFETFPVAYLEGRAPAARGELALSRI
ncbi:MAG: hypothetical protein LBI84_04660 [Propionibacteriaceae bacterium]|jgi:putative ABC transport system permease protein|nr:hypothetical protein [Propionibacteriaceae bacterium]